MHMHMLLLFVWEIPTADFDWNGGLAFGTSKYQTSILVPQPLVPCEFQKGIHSCKSNQF